MAPDGFDSVSGTEANQQVLRVTFPAWRGDQMAKMLLAKGDVFGKQYVVYDSCQAYPAYVVTYTCPDDFTPDLEPPQKRRYQYFRWAGRWTSLIVFWGRAFVASNHECEDE